MGINGLEKHDVKAETVELPSSLFLPPSPERNSQTVNEETTPARKPNVEAINRDLGRN
jgi:hypothetical protein